MGPAAAPFVLCVILGETIFIRFHVEIPMKMFDVQEEEGEEKPHIRQCVVLLMESSGLKL